MTESQHTLTEYYAPAGELAELKNKTLEDCISGQQVRATPEEREAVQVFAKRLLVDYSYPKGNIQTHPQFRVRARPSDEGGSYPIDISVFRGSAKTESNIFMIVECKQKNRNDGIEQLKLYLTMSAAEIGVWFNGQEHAYLRKVVLQNGTIRWEDLPNIPRFKQRIEDIGRFARKDLRKPSNLKAVFRDIRNHLAGNVTGITRDEALAQEIINLLFCKIYDETFTGATETVQFRSGHGEKSVEVEARIVALFSQVKHRYNDVFSSEDSIKLDAESINYVIGELQNYSVTEADRDAIGDAFEVFIGPALRGTEGQFFTPRNVIRMMVDVIDPKPEEMILDPACGSGGFLIIALEHIWKKLEKQGKDKGWSAIQIDRMKREAAEKFFWGIDKDSFLAKVTKAYMAIVGDGKGGVFCENTLEPPTHWRDASMRDKVKLHSFDVVLTNPPFGTKIQIKGDRILSQFDLGRHWVTDKTSGAISKTTILASDRPPQLLFLERCLQLLKPGGRLGIVLPEAIFGMPTYDYVVTWLNKVARIRGIVSMPEPLFKTSGKGGTHAKVVVVFIENTPPDPSQDDDIYMADAKWCGHDSRGNPTIRRSTNGTEVLLDDVPIIAERFKGLFK